MKRFGLLAAAALASATLLPAAHAQTAAPLTYAQPLTPQAVKEVQQRLRQIGAYSGAVDGVWGGDSAAALQRFQQSRGLQVTGQLNQATVATLGIDPSELVAHGTAVVPAPSQAYAQPLRPDVVRRIQSRLGELGFYRGRADGVWGDRSTAALERFQQSRGLEASGELNPSTATAMGLDPNNLMAETRAPLSGSSRRTR
jgi:peptidoglycan hydrolase-like protein with peptidoglycan-binding domain